MKDAFLDPDVVVVDHIIKHIKKHHPDWGKKIAVRNSTAGRLVEARKLVFLAAKETKDPYVRFCEMKIASKLYFMAKDEGYFK